MLVCIRMCNSPCDIQGSLHFSLHGSQQVRSHLLQKLCEQDKQPVLQIVLMDLDEIYQCLQEHTEHLNTHTRTHSLGDKLNNWSLILKTLHAHMHMHTGTPALFYCIILKGNDVRAALVHISSLWFPLELVAFHSLLQQSTFTPSHQVTHLNHTKWKQANHNMWGPSLHATSWFQQHSGATDNIKWGRLVSVM